VSLQISPLCEKIAVLFFRNQLAPAGSKGRSPFNAICLLATASKRWVSKGSTLWIPQWLGR